MTIADEARANALNFEAVKYAYRQSKDGIVVSFVVHPSDVPAGLATAPLGSRYIAVLVQVGDDEKPVKQSAEAQPERKDSVSTARATSNWREKPVSSQVAIRVSQSSFALFLREEHPDEWHETTDAEECIKLILGVTRKRDIQHNHRALVLWKQIEDQYQVWSLKVQVGA